MMATTTTTSFISFRNCWFLYHLACYVMMRWYHQWTCLHHRHQMAVCNSSRNIPRVSDVGLMMSDELNFIVQRIVLCRFKIPEQDHLTLYAFNADETIEFMLPSSGETAAVIAFTKCEAGYSHGIVEFKANIGNRKISVSSIRCRDTECRFSGPSIQFPVSDYADDGTVEFDTVDNKITMSISHHKKRIQFA